MFLSEDCALDNVLIVDRETADVPEMAKLLLERAAYLEELYPGSAPARGQMEARASELALYGMRQNRRLVGCGSLIAHPGFIELKQVFLSATSRGAGLGKYLLAALETEAINAKATLLQLEVGVRQDAAIRLYRHAGYVEIGPFGDYCAGPTSLFFRKRLKPQMPAPAT